MTRRWIIAGVASLCVVARFWLLVRGPPGTGENSLRHQVAGVWLGPVQPCPLATPACARQLEIAEAKLREQLGDVRIASVVRYSPPVTVEGGRLAVYGASGSWFAFTLADGRERAIGFVCPGTNDFTDFCR